MTTKKRPQVACPTCEKPTPTESEHWPFCSKRCKLIDLGEWAKESYRVPGETINPDTSSEEQEN